MSLSVLGSMFPQQLVGVLIWPVTLQIEIWLYPVVEIWDPSLFFGGGGEIKPITENMGEGRSPRITCVKGVQRRGRDTVQTEALPLGGGSGPTETVSSMLGQEGAYLSLSSEDQGYRGERLDHAKC